MKLLRRVILFPVQLSLFLLICVIVGVLLILSSIEE